MLVWIILCAVLCVTCTVLTVLLIKSYLRNKKDKEQVLYIMTINRYDFELRITRVEASAIIDMVNTFVYLTGSDAVRIKKKFS